MKLGTVLTSCDLNPLYSEFVPIFIKAWNKLFPYVDVIIILIANEIPSQLKPYEKNIRLFKPLRNIHTAFQAQCIRLLYPRQIQRHEGVLITDMDMLPMNRSYYIDHIKHIPDDAFVTYRDVCLPNEIAICYNIALPSVWESMFSNLPIEYMLQTWYENSNYDGKHGGTGWGTDQQILLRKFNEWNGKKVTLNDSITSFNRLDRVRPWVFLNRSQLQHVINIGAYSDYHCLRPYSEHKDINDFVVSCLL
jgi:hypothetical protein